MVITATLLLTFSVIQMSLPHVGHGEGKAVGRRDVEHAGNGPAEVHAGDLVRAVLGEPELPSGPAVIAHGPALGADVANSVMWPLGSMRPILFPVTSVNQRSPSGGVRHVPRLAAEVGRGELDDGAG